MKRVRKPARARAPARKRKATSRRRAAGRSSDGQSSGSDGDLLREFPIFDRAPNWYFRVEEVSEGRYRVEGRDLLGRHISRTGSDEDRLLDECAAEATAIDQRDG